ncbi:MAG TPA: hypothetical protein VHT05_08805 [Candidatus Elarobacter sp.]|nr:hypothetical protein [Candidatus Elarobacter sp.]
MRTFTSPARRRAESETSTRPLQRLVRAAAQRFARQPDLSLINVKFTDSLERELLERATRTRV